jgi:hypothetical protein
MKRAFANSAFANSHIINTCSFSLTIAGRICEEFGYNPQTGDFKKYASVLDSLVKIAIYFDCDFAKYFNLWLIHEKFKNPYLSAWLNMNEEEIT